MNDRILSRAYNEKARWTLHKYVGFPRVVSHRVTGLPPTDSALRQVVVKMQSKQSLVRFKHGVADGEESAGESESPKQVLEYLVLQRRIFKAVEGPWKIWGTAEETKPKDVLDSDVRK